jgi:hypothetical protein
MNWIRFLLIFFLVSGFSLFQMDQVIDLDWLVCDNSLSEEINDQGLGEDKDSQFDEKPISNLREQFNTICQLKNPLSVLFPFFWGTAPFLRSPPES